MSERDRIQTEVIDPEAPVRYVRLVVEGEEQAVIPWDEARAIADEVNRYEPTLNRAAKMDRSDLNQRVINLINEAREEGISDDYIQYSLENMSDDLEGWDTDG